MRDLLEPRTANASPGRQAGIRPSHCVLAAVLLLVPCVWQPRIHAGDLSSHIYNAWLATLIEKGQAPGLTIQPMYTNVLFDVFLETLFRRFGADWAQRLASGSVVLVFAGGVFVYLWAVGGKRPWFLFPTVAMLAYGWVFHMGFFNFLLSLGFALMALGLFFQLGHTGPGPWRFAAGCVLLALSMGAHIMPALWAVGMAIYHWVYGRLKPRWTPVWLVVSMIAIAVLRLVLNARYETYPPSSRGTSLIGADQFWIFGGRSFVFIPLMLLVWGLLFMRVVEARSPLRILLGFPAQGVILNMAAILLLPGAVFPPGHPRILMFITERISLFVAISICAMLASARPRLVEMALMAAVCGAYFLMIYVKGRDLDRLEDKMDRIVETLPPNSLVVAPLTGNARTNQWGHMIDRACVGRCFSYANYEPSTNYFRIRLNGVSPFIAPDFDSSAELQAGEYHPPPESPGYYQIDGDCGKGPELCAKYVAGPPDRSGR
jgi:hypothetical protein